MCAQSPTLLSKFTERDRIGFSDRRDAAISEFGERPNERRASKPLVETGPKSLFVDIVQILCLGIGIGDNGESLFGNNATIATDTK